MLFTETAQALGRYAVTSDRGKAQRAIVATALHKWARGNATELGLECHEPDLRPIKVEGFNSTLRIDANGQPWVNTVVQIVQRRHDLAAEHPILDGIVPKAGTTIVADALGNVHYRIAKPLAADHPRLAELTELVERRDRADPRAPYARAR